MDKDGTITYNYYYDEGDKKRKIHNKKIEWDIENYKGKKKELMNVERLSQYQCGTFFV